MAKVSVYNMEGKAVGEIELKDEIFGVEINEHLVHLAVLQQLANNRQGTQKAKTRGEVRGGGKKPWRQKGTGHARQGSIRAPQWKGGGVVFAGKIFVINDLSLDEIKTKKFQAALDALKLEKALVVLDELDQNVILSARNIPDVKTAQVNTINVYDILKYDSLMISESAVHAIEEVYA